MVYAVFTDLLGCILDGTRGSAHCTVCSGLNYQSSPWGESLPGRREMVTSHTGENRNASSYYDSWRHLLRNTRALGQYNINVLDCTMQMSQWGASTPSQWRWTSGDCGCVTEPSQQHIEPSWGAQPKVPTHPQNCQQINGLSSCLGWFVIQTRLTDTNICPRVFPGDDLERKSEMIDTKSKRKSETPKIEFSPWTSLDSSKCRDTLGCVKSVLVI